MTVLQSRAVALLPGGDGLCRSYDPNGRYFQGNYLAGSAAPVVSLTSSQDQQFSPGDTATITFTSTYPGKWKILAKPSSDCTITYAYDGLSVTITWVIPAGQRGDSFYTGAKCENKQGSSSAYGRIHVNRTAILRVGSGETYADLAAAFAVAAAGSTIILKDGTSTSSNNTINNSASATSVTPPNGTYTTYTDGSGNTRYTVIKFTVIMAETPLGFTFDGNNTVQQFARFSGNHGYEAEQIAYDATAGTSQFVNSGLSSIARVGIKVKGVLCKNTVYNGFSAEWSRFIAFEYCGMISKYTDAVGFSVQKSADCLVENCFETGNSRGAAGTYKGLRNVFRRIMTVRQNSSTAFPLQGVSLYESRHTACQNFYDLDAKPARPWVTGGASMGVTYSVAMPETDFNGNATTDYSDDTDVTQVLSLNNYMGSIGTEAYDNTAFATKFRFKNVVAWDCSNYELGYAMINGGPLTLDGCIFGLHRNLCGTTSGNVNFVQTYRNTVAINHMVSHKASVDGSYAGVNAGYHINNSNPSTLSNSTISQFTGTLATGSCTQTNVSTTRVATDTGLDNISRITPGSVLAGLGQGLVDGAKDIFHAIGKLGTFWGETGWNSWSDEDVSESMPVAQFQTVLRAYSYTGNQNLGGTDKSSGGASAALSGNRGFATTSWDLRTYVDSYPLDGANRVTPYVPSFDYKLSGTNLNVRLPRLPSGASSNITDYKMYINGDHAETIPYSTNDGVIVPGVNPGDSFTLQFTYVDSSLGESELSYPVTVTA